MRTTPVGASGGSPGAPRGRRVTVSLRDGPICLPVRGSPRSCAPPLHYANDPRRMVRGVISETRTPRLSPGEGLVTSAGAAGGTHGPILLLGFSAGTLFLAPRPRVCRARPRADVGLGAAGVPVCARLRRGPASGRALTECTARMQTPEPASHAPAPPPPSWSPVSSRLRGSFLEESQGVGPPALHCL